MRGIERPSPPGDRYSKLVLLVAFAVQREESHAFLSGKFQQRSADGGERWRLLEPSVEIPQNPIELRNPKCCVRSRPRSLLIQLAGETRQPNTAGEGKPLCRLVLIL